MDRNANWYYAAGSVTDWFILAEGIIAFLKKNRHKIRILVLHLLMRTIYKRIILLCVFLLPLMALGQEAAKTEKQQEPKATRSQRRAAKAQWKEQRRNERAEKKKIKEHSKIQSKKVRRRTKKDKQKAERVNQNKREFFLKRWFSK